MRFWNGIGMNADASGPALLLPATPILGNTATELEEATSPILHGLSTRWAHKALDKPMGKLGWSPSTVIRRRTS